MCTAGGRIVIKNKTAKINHKKKTYRTSDLFLEPYITQFAKKNLQKHWKLSNSVKIMEKRSVQYT